MVDVRLRLRVSVRSVVWALAVCLRALLPLVVRVPAVPRSAASRPDTTAAVLSVPRVSVASANTAVYGAVEAPEARARFRRKLTPPLVAARRAVSDNAAVPPPRTQGALIPPARLF